MGFFSPSLIHQLFIAVRVLVIIHSLNLFLMIIVNLSVLSVLFVYYKYPPDCIDQVMTG